MTEARKKLLYFVIGAVAVYFAGDFLYRTYVETPLTQKQARIDDLKKKIRAKRKDFDATKAATKKLSTFESLSLPSDLEMARSLYRAWLLELVEKSEFQTAHVDSGSASSKKGIYDALGFSVRGKGSLHNVVRFLYDFYSAGHLHKIQSLSLTPLGKGGNLDVIMTIEALSLSGSERKDSLSTIAAHRLAHKSLEEYRGIAQRNVFGVGGETDESRQAFLTAVTRDGSEPEIWITLRGQDKLLKLHQGSQFEIGNFAGTIVNILEDDVVFESFGERWLLSIGEPLADSVAVPPEY